ncbi:MAG TPA: hypothetical protein VIM97_07025 [Actinomycetes bacterium]
MALPPAGPGVGAGAGSDPAGRRSRRLVGWPVAFILARPPSPRPGHGHRRGGARRGGGWWSSAQRPGDRLVYQVVCGGQPREVPVILRRPGQATGGLLVLGSGC